MSGGNGFLTRILTALGLLAPVSAKAETAEPESRQSGAATLADQSQTQTALVRSVVADIFDTRDGEWGDREWLRVLVNFEALWGDEARPTSNLSFAIARHPGEPLEKVSFRLSNGSKALFATLAEQMRGQNGERWNVCELVIENTGRFSFDFSYDPPYRLSGNLNDTRFKDYLERYRAERGPEQ